MMTKMIVTEKLHLGALIEIFYVALGSSMSLALLVWVGGGLFFYFFGNEPSFGQKSPILYLPLEKVYNIRRWQACRRQICFCHTKNSQGENGLKEGIDYIDM